MDILTFEPENKSAILTLEDLDKTLKFEDGGGKLPASAPIAHADLLKKIVEMSTTLMPKHAAVMAPIVVKQQNCKRIMWSGPADECPLTNYSVERMVAKVGFKGSVGFKGVENAEGSMAIGVSYNEKGIQIAFGHNVRVCSNLNIFGENIFSTYGSGTTRVPFEKGIQLMENWMRGFDDIMASNHEYIRKLQEVVIDERERNRLFGKIYEMAIRFNEGEREIDAPLNVTECNRMVAKGFAHITSKNPITGWDLTNWATSVLKPETSDMVHIMTKNARLNNFLVEEFQLN